MYQLAPYWQVISQSTTEALDKVHTNDNVPGDHNVLLAETVKRTANLETQIAMVTTAVGGAQIHGVPQ